MTDKPNTVGDRVMSLLFDGSTRNSSPVMFGRCVSWHRSSKGSSGLSLGVTPLQVDLHLGVAAHWPDREDVHATHTLQIV